MINDLNIDKNHYRKLKIYREGEFGIFKNVVKLSTHELKKLIKPIQDNVEQKKLNNTWDDYDEWNHALIWLKDFKYQKNPDLIAFTYKKNNKLVGILFISKDDWLKTFTSKFLPNLDISKCVKLGPFHISKESRGIGEKWIREIVIPFLKTKELETILVQSTHSKSFSLYERLGERISSYNVKSDNGKYVRKGKVFRVNLS